VHGVAGAVGDDAGVARMPAPPPSRRRVLGLRDVLREVYGIPVRRPHHAPVEELVLTVLSQSTNDRNRDVAFRGLRERWATWEGVRDAPREAVEEAIRPGGISVVKSGRIQAILRSIAPEGAIDLAWMQDAPIEQARDALTALPGVGRKTAACVLLFSYDRHDVPVDTHVGRVGTRLGLLRPGAPSDELHDAMLALTPVGEGLELHMNLLRHGRRTCAARAPRCEECALLRRCPGRYPRGSTANAITA
jgi:endonuclease-3